MDHKVLVCLIEPTPSFIAVNEFSLYKIFSKYSIVRNIVIYNLENSIKAFIQINEDSVDRCLKKLHRKITDIGKIKVYLYKGNNLYFGQCFSKNSTDFTEAENREKTEIFDNSPEDTPKANFINFDEKFNQQKNSLRTNYPKAKTDCQKINIQSIESNGSTVLDQVKESIDKLCGLSFKNQPSNSLSNQDEPISLKFGNCNKILLVSNLNVRKMNCTNLANLFGCFGNVSKVIINKRENVALVEMESEVQNHKVVKYLNGIRLQNTSLIVKSIRFSETNPFFCGNVNQKHLEFLFYNNKYHRFKEGLHIKINKPSKIVHFTALPSTFNSYRLYRFLSEIHEPVRIVKLERKGISSNMFLVEFDNVSKATEILILVHNLKLEDKLVKISFTHTNLE